MAKALAQPRLPAVERIGRYRAPLSAALALTLAGLAFFALHQLTREIRFSELRAALGALQPWQIWASVALTALSYLTLTIYDVLALRLLGR